VRYIQALGGPHAFVGSASARQHCGRAALRRPFVGRRVLLRAVYAAIGRPGTVTFPEDLLASTLTG
jgi:hypothetical protein